MEDFLDEILKIIGVNFDILDGTELTNHKNKSQLSNVFNYRRYKMNFVLSVWQPCRSSESGEIGLWQKIVISWVGMCGETHHIVLWKLYFQSCY